MSIESAIHLEGTREVVRRYRDSLKFSSMHLDEDAYHQLALQVERSISELEGAIRAYEEKEAIDSASSEWVTLPMHIDPVPPRDRFEGFGTQIVFLSSSLRRAAENLNMKPASPAGFIFWCNASLHTYA